MFTLTDVEHTQNIGVYAGEKSSVYVIRLFTLTEFTLTGFGCMPELAIGAWETESLIGNGFRPYGLGINMATKF